MEIDSTGCDSSKSGGSGEGGGGGGGGSKITIKNITLKAPKRSTFIDNSIWRIFWINSVPKRECASNVRKEYSQIMENMI